MSRFEMAAGRGLRCVVLLLCAFAALRLGAQSTTSACGAAPVAASDAQPNIFSEQQEAWLGEAVADSLESGIEPVRDPALGGHLQAIADRLVATLPPTSIRYRVLLIESPEVNGFSIAGGHIYITRKLAAVAQSDDELAGVLGHEIGHIASHQFAFEMTRAMRRYLKVTAVGDRADIYAKVQAVFDAELRDKHPPGNDTDEDQDEADRIGVYAAVAAGFRPQALPEFFDRAFFVGGRTRSRVADLFRMTRPDERRLRNMRMLAASVPPRCIAARKADVAEFSRWHEAIVADQRSGAAAQAGAETTAQGEGQSTALGRIGLDPPLRMELDQVRFSPDGAFILAQDESSIFVLSREPLRMLFRIDAPDALPANFSPDSKRITFSTPGLHTEEWDLEKQRLVAAHELLLKNACFESKLAPDGRSLLCVGMDRKDGALSLSLIDTSSSGVVWENKAWSSAALDTYRTLMLARMQGESRDVLFSSYTPDNNVLLFGSGPNKVALDLRSRTPVELGKGLLALQGRYAFVGNGRLAALNPVEYESSGIYSFPDGQMSQRVRLPGFAMRPATYTGINWHVLVFGDKFDAGLQDVNGGTLLVGLKVHALDEFGDTLVSETGGGRVGLFSLQGGQIKMKGTAQLPLSPLASLQAVSMSPDGRYVAISTRYRGALWDAAKGKRVALLRGFTDAAWTDEGTVYLDMPKQDGIERHLDEVSVATGDTTQLDYKLTAEQHMRFGRLIEWTEASDKKIWTLRVHDPADGRALWTREFPDDHMGYTASYGDRDLLFSFGLRSATAKEVMQRDSRLAQEAAAVKNKDQGRLLEIVDGKTGERAGDLVLEVPVNYAGIDGVNRAGDLVYVTGEDDRTAVYSMQTGKEVRKLFGVVMALDPETGRVCTANRQGEAVVYDVSGQERAHFQLN